MRVWLVTSFALLRHATGQQGKKFLPDSKKPFRCCLLIESATFIAFVCFLVGDRNTHCGHQIVSLCLAVVWRSIKFIQTGLFSVNTAICPLSGHISWRYSRKCVREDAECFFGLCVSWPAEEATEGEPIAYNGDEAQAGEGTTWRKRQDKTSAPCRAGG